MLVFGQPDIQQPEIDEVIATLKSTWLGTGPRTASFERAFVAYKGVAHTVALNSCTSALMLAIRASGIGPGCRRPRPGFTPRPASCGTNTRSS